MCMLQQKFHWKWYEKKKKEKINVLCLWRINNPKLMKEYIFEYGYGQHIVICKICMPRNLYLSKKLWNLGCCITMDYSYDMHIHPLSHLDPFPHLDPRVESDWFGYFCQIQIHQQNHYFHNLAAAHLLRI